MVIAYGLLIIFSVFLASSVLHYKKRGKFDRSETWTFIFCVVVVLGSAQYIWG